MRPPMGGAGHVVPAPKATQGVLGILMPCYTIGIVMIFVYTMMKVSASQPSSECFYLRILRNTNTFEQFCY